VRRAAGAMAAAAVVAVLGGCAPASDAVRQPAATAVVATPAATPSATPTTTSPTTSTAPAPAPNAALAAALDKLAADSRALKSDAALAGVRTAVASGLASGRKGVQVARTAAYQTSVRSCSQVYSGLSTTRSGAATVAKAAAALGAPASVRQRQIASLQTSIATVRRLAAAQPKSGTPTAAEIDAAVKAATAQAAAEAASLASTRANTADGLARAREMVASATDIYYKAC